MLFKNRATRPQKLYLFNKAHVPLWKIPFLSKKGASRLISEDVKRRKGNAERYGNGFDYRKLARAILAEIERISEQPGPYPDLEGEEIAELDVPF